MTRHERSAAPCSSALKLTISMYRMKLMQVRDVIVSADNNGLLWATKFRHPIVNRAMEVCSRAGDWDCWTIGLSSLVLAPWPSPLPRKVARRVVPRLLIALGVCYSLKRLARRARPSVGFEGFSTLLNDPDPYSFPSSHSACAWAACVAAARAIGGVGWFLTLPAVLISYSRIHVGAHYPLDVLIGSTIGTTVSLVG